MQFGKVAQPELVNFTLPPDADQTTKILMEPISDKSLEVYVGCAKWNKADLKGFYPKGTKDELVYYSRQFNSIELNATFYNMPDRKQIEIWGNKAPQGFKFFPKLTNSISHYKRLIDVQPLVEQFCSAISLFEEKLGTCFLQLHENFTPKDFERLQKMLEAFPKYIPLAVEVRNEKWFSDIAIFEDYCALLQNLKMTNIIVDTAGRRDMLHMRLTNPEAFIRYVGANHSSDITRLEDWIQRIKVWHKQGLQKLYFFVHQNVEMESPLLATYFIKRINEELGLQLMIPQKPEVPPQQQLF